MDYNISPLTDREIAITRPLDLPRAIIVSLNNVFPQNHIDHNPRQNSLAISELDRVWLSMGRAIKN